MPEQKQEKIYNQNIEIDLEGNQQNQTQKTKIPEDSYDATITSVQIIETKKYQSQEKTPKIIIINKIGENEITYFANPTIKKSSGKKGYSNSKIYDLLNDTGLLELFKKEQAQTGTLQGLADWLAKCFVGKKVRVQVENINKGTKEEYSTVKKILRFI